MASAATLGASLVALSAISLKEIKVRGQLNSKICNSKCHLIMMQLGSIRLHSSLEFSWGIKVFPLGKSITLVGSKPLRCISSPKSSNLLLKFLQNSWWEIRDHSLHNLYITSQLTPKELEVSTPMLWAPRRTMHPITWLLLPSRVIPRSISMRQLRLTLRASVSNPQVLINIIIACMEKIIGPKSQAKISFKL